MSLVSEQSTILVHPTRPLSTPDADSLVHRTRILNLEEAAAGTARVVESAPHSDSIPWTIRNKYYTADVRFRIVPASEQLVNVQALGEEPAVIVLARAEQTPPVALASLLETLAARSPEIDVALLVTLPSRPLPTAVISSSPSQTLPVEIDQERWDDLALDHGFEWVDLSSQSCVVQGDDPDSGEQEGLDRIRDALESHMWENLVRIPKNHTPKDVASSDHSHDTNSDRIERRQDKGDDEADFEDDEDELGVPPLPEPRPFAPTRLEFPPTFLPSIARKSPTNRANGRPAPVIPPDQSFDDDFAPFVSGIDQHFAVSQDDPNLDFEPDHSTSFSSNLLPQTLGLDSPIKQDGTLERSDEPDDLESELNSLESLFDKITLARTRVPLVVDDEAPLNEEQMLQRRRDRADQFLGEVLRGM
ncbi:uncharacterized protein JCM15063_000898 [Sporobolomyces koalae]|uniref:uncharacterized protein n=1 Tax=Sporobolomyces koalae TaxID=500713 RepID=UPI00317AA32B